MISVNGGSDHVLKLYANKTSANSDDNQEATEKSHV